MAAEGDRLVVVTPPNGSVERMVHLVTFEATNPGGISVTKGSTQGYYRWDVLPPLSHYGTLAQLQMVDGVIFALLNVNPEPTSGSPAWKLLHVQADGSELAWRELALPRLDPDEPFHFFQDSGKLSVLGSVDGHVMVASRPARTGNSDLPWSSTRLENIDDPNFLWNVIGVAHLNGVPLVAHRTGSPKSSQGSTIEVSELRNGYCIQRTTFAEPDGEWTLAGDGKEIALVHVLDGGYVASWLTGDIGKAREDMVIEKSPTGASSAWSLPVLGALAAVVALFGFVAVALVQRQRPRGQPPE